MAFRRRHGITRSSTFKEETHRHPIDTTSSSSAPSSPLESRKTNQDAHREYPLSSAYANSPFQHTSKERGTGTDKRSQDIQEAFKSQNKKTGINNEEFFTQNQLQDRKMPYEKQQTIYEHQLMASRNGRGTNMDKKTHYIQEDFQLQNKIKIEMNNDDFFTQNLWPDGKKQSEKPKTVHEHQLMASRDVAIATAAKAKLLLREIKTVKADLTFAKERSFQLEEENKMLREGRKKGDHPTDDMIRLQLETLLAEKARLSHENSVYVRENSCLREIIKYHKLNMQDVVYLDEGIEEVAEVNPQLSRTLSVSPISPLSPDDETTDNLQLKDSVSLGGPL